MKDLQALVQRYVDDGSLPGAVALVARGDRIEVAAAGSVDTEGTAPMERDSIFRIASITKPIVAAAVMILVDEGRVALDDPISRWLPELAEPRVVRTPASPLDDLVPAVRPITVLDVLTSTAGYGWPSDFDLPAVQALFPVQRDGRRPSTYPATEADWLAELAGVPLLHQPGEAFLYDTCSVLQGILISRVTGRSMADFLAERLFEPLAMIDTAFWVPADRRGRMTSFYQPDEGGRLVLVDGPDGDWSAPPAFPLGHGGLASTADDWLAFGRLLLAGGEAGGRRLLTERSVSRMLTNHLTPEQRQPGALFLDGHGWGFGGAVDLAAGEPGRVPGRYGWVGGTGTSAHVDPSTGTVSVLLTQRGGDPSLPAWIRDFWTYAAAR